MDIINYAKKSNSEILGILNDQQNILKSLNEIQNKERKKECYQLIAESLGQCSIFLGLNKVEINPQINKQSLTEMVNLINLYSNVIKTNLLEIDFLLSSDKSSHPYMNIITSINDKKNIDSEVDRLCEKYDKKKNAREIKDFIGVYLEHKKNNNPGVSLGRMF